MVRTEVIAGSRVVTLMPNRSATGSQNRLFFLILALVAGFIAVAWSLAGVWVILPFAGLEIMLVGYFLRLTYLKNQASQTIAIDTLDIEIEYITLRSAQFTSLSRESAKLSFSKSLNATSIDKLYLSDHKNKVEIGQFLNKQDRESLILSLRQSGVTIQGSCDTLLVV